MLIDSFSDCTLWGSWDDQYGCPPLPEEEDSLEDADATGRRKRLQDAALQDGDKVAYRTLTLQDGASAYRTLRYRL